MLAHPEFKHHGRQSEGAGAREAGERGDGGLRQRAHHVRPSRRCPATPALAAAGVRRPCTSCVVCGDVKANACHPRVPLLRLACLTRWRLRPVPRSALSALHAPLPPSPLPAFPLIPHPKGRARRAMGTTSSTGRPRSLASTVRFTCVCVWCVTLRRRTLIISKEGKPDSRRDDAYADSDLSSSRIVSTEVQCGRRRGRPRAAGRALVPRTTYIRGRHTCGRIWPT